MFGRQSLLASSFFFFYCLLIIINPLPLGSNRAWAWSIESILVSTLLVLMILLSFKYKHLFHFYRLKKIRWELGLMALWLLFNLLYLIPMPIALLSFLSPNVAEAYINLSQDYGYLSLDVYATLETFMLSVYYVLIFVVGILLVNSRKKIVIVLSLLFILAVIESIYGMYLVSISQTGTFVQLNTVSALHASGTYINKNHLVAFLSICFFAGLCLRILLNRKYYSESANLITKVVRFISSPVRFVDVSLLIIIAAIWGTHSRAGLVSFLLATLFFVGFKLVLMKGRTINIKTIGFLSIAGLMFLIVIADDVTQILNQLGQNSDDKLGYISKTAEGRMLANHQILEFYPRYWFTGVGPGAYEVFFVNHRVLEQDAFFDHAHNDYLEFLIEYGVLSGLILVFLISVIYRIIKCSFYSKSNLTVLLGFAACSSIIYMLLHGTMDFNARIPANVVTLIVVISLTYARLLKQKRV